MCEFEKRRFAVCCRACGAGLLATDRIRDPDVQQIEGHLRACTASEPLEEAPMLGQIMRRLTVVALKV